jgi:hypothetical protein
MKRDLRPYHSQSLWEKFLDWNPQLFRELKGKLKIRNIVVVAAISVIVQFVSVVFLLGDLPDPDSEGNLGTQYGRYGMGYIKYNPDEYYRAHLPYTKDLLDNWVVNWQLLWLDLFIILSIISIFALLIVGIYMLVADMTKEESQGTLNFIRLTPQSAGNILLGKILGVPVLLYTAICLFLPLHTIAGINARIPFSLILSFDGVIVASCAFFYSLALLCSLLDFGLSGFKPWLISGVVGSLLFVLTQSLFRGNYLNIDNPFGWLYLFNPSLVLSYLIDATHLPNNKVDFLPLENLQQLLFYGRPFWSSATIGIGLIIFNLSLWTYWSWSLLKRRFHNPDSTFLSKIQSYWLTGWFVAIALGFTLQSSAQNVNSEYFIFLQVCLVVWGLGLTAGLSPHRQKLHDWSRYRHQTANNGIWHELIFGQNSPSTVAVAINLAIAIAYIVPSIFVHLDSDKHYILWGFIIGAGNIILCAIAAQIILMLKSRKRAPLSVITVASMIVVPPVCLGMADIHLHDTPVAWMFSFIPTVAVEYVTMPTIALTLLGQWLAISLIGFQMSRQLKQAGASETKMLLARSNTSNS